MKVPLVATVPESHRKDGITWLVLEESSSSGVHLYMCDSPAELTVYDYWFETSDQALRAAAEEWGVKEMDWKTEVGRQK